MTIAAQRLRRFVYGCTGGSVYRWTGVRIVKLRIDDLFTGTPVHLSTDDSR